MPVFLHAVASFEPTADAVLLWTRLTGCTEATWELAADPGFAEVLARGTATTGPHRDDTVTVDATGLQPATAYWYRFTAGGETSPVGRTRTLPAGPTEKVLLGVVSCARYAEAPLAVYRAVAEREVDLVLHLGDYIYEDAGDRGRRTHRPSHPATSLQDYRDRLAQMREDPDCQALHLRHPMTAIWDDHDFADNAWRGGAKKHDETSQGPWSARAEAAVRARHEWVPIRLPDPDRPLVSWRAVRLGDLAELVLLDTRLVGRDQPAGDEGALALNDPTRSLLGDEQRAWVQERIADRTCRWSVVTSGVVVNEMPIPFPGVRLLGSHLPEDYATKDGALLRTDQWDGYPHERDRLTTSLAERRQAGSAALLLSGDVHSSWAFEGPRHHGVPVCVEVVVPAVSSPPMGRTRVPGTWRLLDLAVRNLEHVRWVDVTERGFVLLELTPACATVAWWFVNPYDPSASPAPELGQALAYDPDQDPPRWREAMPPAEPAGRAGLPTPLPGRPADLPELRRHHLVRRTAGAVIPLALLGGAVGVMVRVRRRR